MAEMQMQERLARRLARSVNMIERGDESEASWPSWLGTIAALIDEMKNPTEEMLNAAHSDITPFEPEATWEMMINAIQNEDVRCSS